MAGYERGVRYANDMKRLALLLVACLTACSKSPTVSPAPAGESPGTYQGKVMSVDGEPISGTAVFLDVNQWVPIEVEIVDGRYTATLPGTYWIGVKASGYEGHIVQDGKAVLQKALPPVAISHPSPPDEIDEPDDEPVISEKPLQDPYENPASLILGDVTGDDQVSEEDLRAVFEYLLGGNEPSLIKLGDVDGNGTVDWEDIKLLGQYVSSGTSNHGIGERIQLPTASLSPDPSSTVFAADGTWTTYRVQTSADSVLVVVNTGSDDTILEIAGGSRAPSRSYCGAERNDRPSRARRNRWNLHISACGDGQSTIQIKDYRFQTTLVSYSVTVGNPDLIVESPSVDDNTLTAGQSFALRATVRNRGNASAAATTLRYYRSTDATISTGDTEVGTDAVGALAVSGSSAESISLTAPSGEGTYYYGACVDNVNSESNSDNNCSSGVSVTVSGGGGGGGGDGDAISFSGTSCSGSYLIGNSGLADIYISGTVHAHRSVSSLIINGYANGQLVGVDFIGGLGAGKSEGFSISGIISTSGSSLNCSVGADYFTGGSAKVIAGDAESSEQVREQGSLSRSSVLINRKRSLEQP